MRQEKFRSEPDAAEAQKAESCLRIYKQCALMRTTSASHWNEVAQLVMPNMTNTFFPENYNFPGMKKAQKQVDSSGMVALAKFAAICDSMLTPFSSKWHTLEASNPAVQKNRSVRLWMEQASNVLFRTRYMGAANFRKQNQSVFQQIGAFGNGPMFIDRLYDMHGRPALGFRYKAIPLGEVFIRANFQGRVDAFVRVWRMTARQAMQQWGHDMLPEALDAAQDRDSEELFQFLHCVYPNSDYDPGEQLGPNAKPWVSCYIALTGARVMQEGGYFSFPLAFARYSEWPMEIYGRGPAMDVLPALKTLNAEKATFLKVGHRAADPVFLTADDGLADFSWAPGALNKGSVSPDGKPLVVPLVPGNVQITKEMMDEERALIGDVFLTSIFQTLVENPNMTATQVIELINQKGVFLAPTVGAMASDYLEPTIERELDLGGRQGLLPPMPGLLREAKGEYKIVYTSPLFKSARAGEASGFLRTVQTALEVAGQMQDPSILDPFDFDAAIPDIARIQDTPESWMRAPDAIAALRQARAQAQQQRMQVQALPAQAAMMKAQSYVQQHGAGGVPEQGAPQQQQQQAV